MVTSGIACEHCGALAQRVVTATVDGRELNFCCNGCLEVYRTLHASDTRPDAPTSNDGSGATMTSEIAAERISRATIAITGMTCASCSARIEGNLAKLPGVLSANVNLATEKATVVFDPSLANLGEFRHAIEDIGYGIAGNLKPEEDGSDAQAVAVRREIAAARNKVIFALALAAPILLEMFHGQIQWVHDYLHNMYLLWALATPVQFWAGWQFYKGAWAAARHFDSNMNTLIAMGTSAAYF